MPSRWRHDLSLVSILLLLQCTIPASAWAPVSHCVSIYDVVFILSWSDEVRQCKYQPPFATFRMSFRTFRHGVATISRLLTNIRIFCKRALKKRAYSAKETYDFKEPAHWATPPHQFYNDDYYYQNGVALVSRIDKITGLFCKRALQKTRYSAEETCKLIDPTDRSHPISVFQQHYTICNTIRDAESVTSLPPRGRRCVVASISIRRCALNAPSTANDNSSNPPEDNSATWLIHTHDSLMWLILLLLILFE